MGDMDKVELKKHIQEEIAELNRLNGKDRPQYSLLDTEEYIKEMVHKCSGLVDITGKNVIF